MLKNATNRKTMRLYWRYWMRFPKLFILSLLFGPIMAIQKTIVPLFLAVGLGQLVRGQNVDLHFVIYALLSFFVAYTTGYYVNKNGDAQLEHSVEVAMYNDCFDYLVHQDYDFYSNNFSGSLITRANRLVRSYNLFHNTFFLDIMPQFFGVLFALGIMMHYNLLIGFVIGFLWVIAIIAITVLTIRRIPLRRAAVAKESEQTGELSDMVTNALTVKTFTGEDQEIERYKKTNAERGRLTLLSWERAVRNGWVIEVICGSLQMAVFVGGVIAVEHHIINLAVFLLFQVYIIRIVDSVRQASLSVRQLEGVFGEAQEMTDQMEVKSKVIDIAQPETSRISQGNVVWKNVSFDYQENASSHKKLLRNFSIDIKASEKVGLVGPSGGGKTTLTKLLLRFMDIDNGQILIDGQNIAHIKQDDLRRALAYVPQEPLLFHRSVKENIRYAKPGASDEEIIAAAKKAHADDFIKELLHGYDTLVGERGVKLSGGQRQRIAIARAILKDAPILVLDEATSALDSESESLIQDALWKLMEGRTAIVIAHRLSTIQKMDRIVVLDKGVITEQGSHKELLMKKGIYAKLWNRQSGGFIED